MRRPKRDLHHLAFDRHRLADVVGAAERVMGVDWYCSQRDDRRCNDEK
jgi:hypothetical protein